jgi:hypothetical protein
MNFNRKNITKTFFLRGAYNRMILWIATKMTKILFSLIQSNPAQFDRFRKNQLIPTFSYVIGKLSIIDLYPMSDLALEKWCKVLLGCTICNVVFF